MPKKLDKCIKKVKDEGKSEDSAYAICSSSTGIKKKKGGGWTKPIKESFYYAYYQDANGEFERLGVIDACDISEWLQTEAKEYEYLKLVKSTGNYMELVALDEEWDVVNRGTEDLLFHEKTNFKRFSRESSVDKKVKRATKDKPQDQRKHHMKASRGTDRKNQNYVPIYRQIEHQTTLPTADNVLKNAKSATSGAWKLSKRQVQEIAAKYKFNVPTAKKRSKHLGSTGIVMWRKSPKDYYLVKFSKHHPGFHPSGKKKLRSN